MAQCATVGSIKAPFTVENGAQFKPLHQDDLHRAVSTGLDSGLKGQFALRGGDSIDIKSLLGLIEKSCGKEEGSTKALREIPGLPLGRMLEEFFTGICQDTNMAEMVWTFNQGGDPVPGNDYWSASGTQPEQRLGDWYGANLFEEEDLIRPSFGSYKTSFGDNSV